MTRRVLMASPVYWDSPFRVGTHHFARVFVELGFKVAYVSDPISPLHLFGEPSDALRSRYALYRRGGRWELNGKLWAYVPGALATPHNKPFLSNRWLARNWNRMAAPDPVSVASREGFGAVELLFLDSPSQSFWLDRLKYRKSILRLADRTLGFRKASAGMQDMERHIAQRVDLVIYAARDLEDYIVNLGAKRALHLPNGVDFRHFAGGSRQPPAEFGAISRPIAIYVGAMEEWFDFELVNEAAKQLGNISFVMIGPNHHAKRRIRKRANVHLLGPKAFDELPRYLYNADVGIVPFDVSGHGRLVHSIHPLKLYEYMACGLPVVSVAWNELKSLGSPARLCVSRAEFIAALAETVSQGSGQAPLVEYASRQDWRQRVARLIEVSGI